MNEKQKDIILEIIDSESFDKEAFIRWRSPILKADIEDDIRCIADILQKQYVDISIENILLCNDKEAVIDFLNRLIQSILLYENVDKGRYEDVSLKELAELRQYAEEVGEISIEELSRKAPVLTIRTYLDMCRLVYDEIFEWKYPKDISNAYLFCEARMFEFAHEYKHGILGINWDSPKEFARVFNSSYHNEELRFGGPHLYIKNESFHNCNDVDPVPEIYDKWIGDIYCTLYNKKSMYEALKMYIVLRMNGYPVKFSYFE